MAGMSADDRCAVSDLIARYAFCLDLDDVDAFTRLWAEDAVLESGGGTAIGREEIRQWFLARAARVAAGDERVCHFVGLPSIRGDGETSTATTYCTILRWHPERGNRIHMVGRYEDAFAKVDGEWRFRKRVINAEPAGTG